MTPPPSGARVKFGPEDFRSKPEISSPDQCSGQVRSLTYDVMSKPLYDLKMVQTGNADNVRISSSGKCHFL